MTEKLYRMVNTNLVDDDGSVYYLIKKDEDDVCQVFGKHTAKAIVDELNKLNDEKGYWKQKSKEYVKRLIHQKGYGSYDDTRYVKRIDLE